MPFGSCPLELGVVEALPGAFTTLYSSVNHRAISCDHGITVPTPGFITSANLS